MNERYLGNDTNVNRLAQASDAAVTAPAQAAAEMTASTTRVTDTIIQGQAQLQQIEMQRLQSEVARASKPSGLVALANEGIKTVFREKNNRDNKKAQEAKLAAEQEKERQRLTKEALEKQREEEFARANDDVYTLQAEYEKNNWARGTTNFKDESAKLIARYPNLTAKQINEILSSRVNSVVVAREAKSTTQALEEVKALNNQTTDTLKAKLEVRLKPELAQLSKLSIGEQSTDFLQQRVQPIVDKFFQNEGKSLSQIQKLKIEQSMYAQIAEPLGEKSEAYATYLQEDRARKQWIEGIAIANQKLESGEITKAEYKDIQAQLFIETGKDFSEYQVTLEEAAADKLKFAEQINRWAELESVAEDRAIANLPPPPQEFIRQITAKLLTDNSFILKYKSDPRVNKTPWFKEAERNAELYKEARSELANQKIADAGVAVKFQELNLTNVNNFVRLAKQITLKTNQQKILSPLEGLALRYFKESAASNATIGAALGTIEANPNGALKPQQLKELQAGLAAQWQGLAQIQQAIYQENESKREKLQTEYADVWRLWGGFLEENVLRKYANSESDYLEKILNERQQQIKDAGSRATQASPYGARSNFKDVGGGLVGSRQQNGGFKIAPKTSLQVQKHPSGDFITPIAAGVRASHSFNMGRRGGRLGGGYGAWRNRRGRGWVKAHSGIDFPLRIGQKAVTPVSGKVLSVRNLRGYGGTVDVLGDNGFVYRYAHQRSFVKAGDRVEAGDAISTPNGSGAGAQHLHFEVRPHAAYKKSQFGMGGTIDPVTHLRELTKQAGTRVGSRKKDLRGQPTKISEQQPFSKVESNTLLTPGGGAVSGNLFQQVGEAPKPAQAVFNHQRPMTSTTGLVSFRAGTPEYNYQSNFGSSYLSERPQLVKAFVDAAKELKVPTEWLVDIAAQESGAFRNARSMHNSGYGAWGLFGFTKGSGVKNYKSMNEVQQVHAFKKYLIDNGWLKHYAKVGGNASIDQLWAISRMGWNMRKRSLRGENPNTIHMNDTGKTYADELRLLGNHFGREYDVPGGSRSGRSRRNSAIRENPHSNLQQTLAASGTFIPTREG